VYPVAECSVQGPLLWPMPLVTGGSSQELRVLPASDLSPPKQESVPFAAVHAECEAEVSGKSADIMNLHCGNCVPEWDVSICIVTWLHLFFTVDFY